MGGEGWARVMLKGRKWCPESTASLLSTPAPVSPSHCPSPPLLGARLPDTLPKCPESLAPAWGWPSPSPTTVHLNGMGPPGNAAGWDPNLKGNTVQLVNRGSCSSSAMPLRWDI